MFAVAGCAVTATLASQVTPPKSAQPTALIDALVQFSYSHCGVRGREVASHEAARQLTQNVRWPTQRKGKKHLRDRRRHHITIICRLA